MNIAEIVATETTAERLARWAVIDQLHADGLYYWQGPETLASFEQRARWDAEAEAFRVRRAAELARDEERRRLDREHGLRRAAELARRQHGRNRHASQLA